MKASKMWIGGGIRMGGSLFITGVTGISGKLVRLDSLDMEPVSFYTDPSFRFGPGLGGAFDLVFMLIYGADIDYDLNRLDVSSGIFPDINITVEESLSDIVNLTRILGGQAKWLPSITKALSESKDVKTFNWALQAISNTAFATNIMKPTSANPSITSFVCGISGYGAELSCNWYLNGIRLNIVGY